MAVVVAETTAAPSDEVLSPAEVLHVAVRASALRFASLPNVELEFRLGTCVHVAGRSPSFCTDVGEGLWRRVLRSLLGYQGWEDVRESQDEVVRWSDGTRVVTCTGAGAGTAGRQAVCVRKRRVQVIDVPVLEGCPLAVRFAVSTEEPSSPGPTAHPQSVLTRHRTSFLRKNMRVDVTRVQERSAAPQFQVELEIVDPTAVVDEDALFSLVHKVIDVQKTAVM